MSDTPESMAVVPAGAIGEVQPQTTTEEIEVSAQTPNEMRSAQANLILWCERKVASMKRDFDELSEAYDVAKERKWKTTTLARHRDIARKRWEYYSKMLAAFKAGYMLVPNFPLGVFAVRTDRNYPKRLYTSSNWGGHHTQTTSFSPVGEGEYQNPEVATIKETTKVSDGKGGSKEETRYVTGDDWNEIDFPLNMAKPHIMEVTSYAMGLKIFDEIGILPSPKKNVDPVICGTIRLKTGPYVDRTATFMIGWHIDTRTL